MSAAIGANPGSSPAPDSAPAPTIPTPPTLTSSATTSGAQLRIFQNVAPNGVASNGDDDEPKQKVGCGILETASTSRQHDEQAATELSIVSQPIVIAAPPAPTPLSSPSPRPNQEPQAPHIQEHQQQQQQQQQQSHQHHLPDMHDSPASFVQLPPSGAHRTNHTLRDAASSPHHHHHQQTSAASAAANGASSSASSAAASGQWMVMAAQTTQGMRHRMSLASDQLGISLRQLYASASSITDVPPSYHNIPGIVPYYHGRSSGPPPSYDDVINPFAPPPTYQSLFGQMREARKTSRGLLDLLQRLLIILISTLGCTILIAFMILIPFTMIIVGAVYIDECRVEHIPAFLLVGGLVWASKNIIHCYAQCQHPPTSTTGSGSGTTGGGGPEPQISEFSHDHGHQSAAPITTITVSGNPDETYNQTSSTTNTRSQQQQQQQSSIRLKTSICESLLNCVLFGWFVAGCVIVFRNYEPDFDNQDSLRYCHRTVYMYTFWLITSAIIISGLFIGCICCLMVSSAIAGRQEDDLG